MGKNKIIIIFIIFMVFAAGALTAIGILNAKIKKLSAKYEKEFSEKLKRQTDIVKKDLQEKHAADTVSYEAMAKRLELEKKKSEVLEERLKNQTGKPAKK